MFSHRPADYRVAVATTPRLSALLLLWIGSPLLFGSCSEPEVVDAGDIPVLDAQGVGRELAALEGKPLLVNLWATWCPPCVKEMPALSEVHESVAAAGGEVVGINLDLLDDRYQLKDQAKKIEDFVARRVLPFPVWIWNGEDKAAMFGALGIDDPGGIPVTIAVDAKGKVIDTHVGEADLERLEELFELARGRRVVRGGPRGGCPDGSRFQ